MEGLKYQVEAFRLPLGADAFEVSLLDFWAAGGGSKGESMCLEAWRCWLWSTLHSFSRFGGVVEIAFQRSL